MNTRIVLKKELNPITKTAVCNICGERRKMSKDHVPLKSIGNSGRVILKPHHTSIAIKNTISQDGIAFHTICQQCNNLLGSSYDHYYSRLAKQVIRFSNGILRSGLILPRYSEGFDTIPSNVARSVIGHMLASKIKTG